MTLEQIILNELRHIELGGMRILGVISKPDATQITFEIPPAVVEFKVNDKYQYQILKVIYDGVPYENSDYLNQFNPMVIDIIKKVKPIEIVEREAFAKQLTINRIPQSQLEALEQREQEIAEQETQLEKKEQEIKVREELLGDKEKMLASERADLLKEKDARKILNRERSLQAIKKYMNPIAQYAKKSTDHIRNKSKSESEEDDDLDIYFDE